MCRLRSLSGDPNLGFTSIKCGEHYLLYFEMSNSDSDVIKACITCSVICMFHNMCVILCATAIFCQHNG